MLSVKLIPGLVTLLFLTTQSSLAVEVGPWDSPTSHRITGTITFPTPNTLVINGFGYDNGGRTVFLYFYAPGQSVDGRNGRIIPVPGGGSRGTLNRRYTNEQLAVELPSGVTACDIGALTVWCEPFFATFSRVTIPRSVFIDQGQGECRLLGGNTDLPMIPPTDFDNCEPFSDSLQVSWTVDTENMEVDFQICSCRPLDPDLNQYMAFGLSGRMDSTFMIGADVTVAWVDNQMGNPNAVDYYLTERAQCRGGRGACPDTEVILDGQQTCRDDIRPSSIIGGTRNSNEQCVIFSRPFTTDDDSCDTVIDPTNTDQFIVWANGGIEETAFIHFDRADPSTPAVHLGRPALDRCTEDITCSSCPLFAGQRMDLPTNTTLRARIGPSAGERGYMGITGQIGWGIAWYIDGMLIPELVVQRGQTYTFIVEGGDDPDPVSRARYHPFYISSSPNGGRLLNDQDQVSEETVYAGFDAAGEVTAVGRLCEYEESQTATTIRETCGRFADYLTEVTSNEPDCESGVPGMLTWTPDENTPDIVYYQCATHRNLGWRIIVNGASPMRPFLSLTASLLFTLATLLLRLS